jgi:hypothetical protein
MQLSALGKASLSCIYLHRPLFLYSADVVLGRNGMHFLLQCALCSKDSASLQQCPTMSL